MTETPSNEELTLFYHLSEDDLRALTSFVVWRQLKWIFLPLVGIGACSLCGFPVAVITTAAASFDGRPQSAAIFLPMIFPAFFLLSPFITLRTASRRTIAEARQAGLLDAPHFIKLTPESVFSRVPGNEGTRAWRLMHSVERTECHIFVFAMPNMAHMIPRSAFATPAEADRFYETAKRWFDAARSQPE